MVDKKRLVQIVLHFMQCGRNVVLVVRNFSAHFLHDLKSQNVQVILDGFEQHISHVSITYSVDFIKIS